MIFLLLLLRLVVSHQMVCVYHNLVLFALVVKYLTQDKEKYDLCNRHNCVLEDFLRNKSVLQAIFIHRQIPTPSLVVNRARKYDDLAQEVQTIA